MHQTGHPHTHEHHEHAGLFHERDVPLARDWPKLWATSAGCSAR